MRFKITLAAIALGATVTACSKNDDFSDQEWGQIQNILGSRSPEP